MNALTYQFKPFSSILSRDPMPKKDFLRLAHGIASSSEQYLVNMLQMIQFSRVYKEGNDIVLE